jgi:hypothetical protein
MTGHGRAEARSIAMHAAIAARLPADPAPLERARERVREWRERGEVPYYAAAWSELFAEPLATVCAALVDPGERMCALRQVTPFAGALDPRERWRILRSVEGTEP